MNVSHNSVSCYDESHLWILEHGFIHCVIYPNWDASKHVPPKKGDWINLLCCYYVF